MRCWRRPGLARCWSSGLRPWASLPCVKSVRIAMRLFGATVLYVYVAMSESLACANLSVCSRVRRALSAVRRSPPGRHGRIQALLHLPWRQRRARCCGRQGHQGQWGREWDQNHTVLFMSSRHLLYLSVAQRGQVAAATFSGQRSRGRWGRGGGGGRRLAVPGL